MLRHKVMMSVCAVAAHAFYSCRSFATYHQLSRALFSVPLRVHKIGTMSPHRRAWDIYAAQLLERGYGYPMWHPEPGQNGSAPEIGDVGYMYEGRFRRMFNVTRPPRANSEKSYCYRPLQYDEELCVSTPDALQSQIISSHSVNYAPVSVDAAAEKSAEPVAYGYTCSGPRGALLLLDGHADSKSVRPNRLFPEYMKKYHKDWMQQAQTKGLDVNKVAIVLVRGAVWTRNWTVAVFHNAQGERNISGQVIATDDGLALSDRSKNDSRVEYRSALDIAHDEDIQNNQCIFLPHYKIKYRVFPFPLKIEAAAGPGDLPPPDGADLEAPAIPVADTGEGNGGEDGHDVVQTSDASPTGPIDVLLDYILRHSDAEVAVACEEDVNSLFVVTPRRCAFAEWLEHELPEIEVEDGLGMLSLRAAVARERRAAIDHLMRNPGEEIPGEAHARPSEGYKNLDEKYDHISCPFLRSKPLLGNCECQLWRSNAVKPVILDWPHLVLRDDGTKTGIRCTSLSLSEELVLTGADDGFIRVWNVKTGRLVRRWHAQGAVVQCVAFSPTEAQIASGLGDGAVLLWDMGPLVADQVPYRLEGHSTNVRLVAYSPDGKQLASASVDTTVKIWDPLSRALLRVLKVHDTQPTHLAWTPDGSRIVACPDAMAVVWDKMTGTQLALMQGLTGASWSRAVSHGGGRVSTDVEADAAHIWDLQSGEEFVGVNEPMGPVWDVVWSLDDPELATGSYGLCVVTNGHSSTSEHRHIIAKSSSPVQIVAYSRTRRYVASANEDGTVQLWNRPKGNLIAEWHGHRARCKSMAFINEDKDLLSSSEDGSLRLWSVQDVLRLM